MGQSAATEKTPFWREMDVWQVLVCVLVLIYLSVILLTFTEYGITIDEPPQAKYGQEIAKWYLSLFHYEAFFDRIETLDLERYGGFFDTVLYPVTRISPFQTYDTRHLCYALLGLLGVVGAYRLGATAGSSATGFFAALFLVLTPRFYGHAFNNPKDLPFAVFYLWSVYFLVRCLRRLPELPGRLIWTTGLAIGLTLGTRVGGLILLGYLGLFFVLRCVQIGGQTETSPFDLIRRLLFQSLAIAAIAWVTMLIFWPTAQRSPILFPIDALLNFSQCGTPDFTTTFFEGKRLDINQVPWYYAPKWFLIALPEFLFLGLAAGAAVMAVRLNRWRKAGLSWRALAWGLLGFSAFFPLFYVVVLGTPLYDGLRHFLFVIPPLAILSAAGMEALVCSGLTRWARRITIGLFAALLGLTLWDMVRLHPNEVVYFNRLFAGGLKEASKYYQTDYWENSHRQGLRWLDAYYEKHHPNRKLRISAGGGSIQFGLDPDRYEFLDIPVEADFYLSITRDDRHKMVPGEIVHTVERDGVPLLYIIRPDSSYRNDPFFAPPGDRYIHLAWQYLQAGDFEKSLSAYARVLENDPRNPMVYHNVAFAHYRLGHFQETVDYSRLALALKPTYVKARLTLARGLQALGRGDEAVHAYREALRLQPEASAYRDLGAMLAEQGQFAEAEAALKEAVGLDATQAVPWYLLAQIQRLGGRLDLARQHILKALALDPSRSDFQVEHLNVGRAYQRKGEIDRASAVYREAVAMHPQFPEAHLHLGVLYFRQGDYTEAALAFEHAVQVLPKDPRMHMGLAQAYEQLQQNEAAIASYRGVLSLTDSPEARSRIEALLSRAASP